MQLASPNTAHIHLVFTRPARDCPIRQLTPVASWTSPQPEPVVSSPVLSACHSIPVGELCTSTSYSTVQYPPGMLIRSDSIPLGDPPSPTHVSIGRANACRRFTSTPSCKSSLPLRRTLRWAHRPGCGPSQRDGEAKVQFLLRALARAEPVPQNSTAGRVQIRVRPGQAVPPDHGSRGGGVH